MAITKLKTNTEKVNVIGRLPGLPETHQLHNCRVCLAYTTWEDGSKARLYFIIDKNNIVQWLDVCNDFQEFHYRMDYEFSKFYKLNDSIFYNQRFKDSSSMTHDEYDQNEHFIYEEESDLKILNSIK